MAFDISDFITGGLDDLAKGAINIIDEFVETPDEKRQAHQKVQQLANELAIAKSNEVIAEINARGKVVEAELKQSDTYTKRARPTLVYAGLVLIFLCYFVAPFYFDGDALALPQEFWLAWGATCSIWSIGRSAEYIAPKSKAAQLLNTVEPYKNAVARVIGRGK